MYAAQFEALLLLNYISLSLFVFFLRKFELPAITEWNPFGSYCPSEMNPRCGY